MVVASALDDTKLGWSSDDSFPGIGYLGVADTGWSSCNSYPECCPHVCLHLSLLLVALLEIAVKA